MSLTWGSYSTPDVTSNVQSAKLRLTGVYDFSGAYEDNAVIDCAIDFMCYPTTTQQGMLDLLTPLYDALVAAGWSNVQLSQAAEVSRIAS